MNDDAYIHICLTVLMAVFVVEVGLVLMLWLAS